MDGLAGCSMNVRVLSIPSMGSKSDWQICSRWSDGWICFYRSPPKYSGGFWKLSSQGSSLTSSSIFLKSWPRALWKGACLSSSTEFLERRLARLEGSEKRSSLWIPGLIRAVMGDRTRSLTKRLSTKITVVHAWGQNLETNTWLISREGIYLRLHHQLVSVMSRHGRGIELPFASGLLQLLLHVLYDLLLCLYCDLKATVHLYKVNKATHYPYIREAASGGILLEPS